MKSEQKPINVAVVGATGAVGEEMIQGLESRKFPVGTLLPLTSERSAGTMISFSGREIETQNTTLEAFENIDLALFSAGSNVSQEWGRQLAQKGIVVIDNSRAFRMDSDVPLVVPEVNTDAISDTSRLIANPNCSTIQLVVALAALGEVCPLKRIVITTFQSASGAGRNAMDELRDQTVDLLNFREPKVNHFSRRLAFDVLPQIDTFEPDGYTGEEHKMINETRKILNLPDLPVTVTCVRVPVFVGHSMAVNVEFERDFAMEAMQNALANAQNLIFNEADEDFPTASDCAGADEVFVGRLRRDKSIAYAVDLWITADNLRKGAATNAIQIAEEMLVSGRWT